MPRSHTQRVGSVIASASGDDWVAPRFNGAFNSSEQSSYIGDVSGTAVKLGLLFRGLLVPQGATITSAKLQLCFKTGAAGTASLLIKGVAQDSPTAPSSNATSDAMTRTTASVAWEISATPTDGQVIDSPDIAAVIQEIVDRAGFNGSSLALFVEDNGASGNYRELYTVDSFDVLYHPRLTITWDDADDIHTVDAPYVWTVPAGWESTLVECWGAGGFGGAASHASARAGGGGGGAYSASTVATTPAATVVIRAGHGAYASGYEHSLARSYYVDESTVMAEYARPADMVSSDAAGAGAAGGAASTSVGTTKQDGGAGASGQATTGGGGGGSATSSAVGGTATTATGGTGEASGATATSGQGANAANPGGGGAGSSNGFFSGGYGGHGRVRLTKVVSAAGGAGVSGSTITDSIHHGYFSKITRTMK